MAIKFKELKLSLGEEQLEEAKRKPPFDPDPKPKKTPRNSDGTKTSGMSRARQLAKRGIKLKEVKDSKAYSRASKELRAVKDPIEGANLKKLALILDRLGKVSLINSGDLLNQLNKIVNDMDTDVREVVFRILQKNGLMESSVNESVELDEKFSWNDVNNALTKANYMRAKPSEIEKVAAKFKYKSGKDKNFSLSDVKKNLSAAGIDGANQHNVMKHMKEEPEEEKPMMKGQIESMEHYLEGIEEYLESTPDPEEWFQNKLTKAHSELSSLYSYSKGEDGDEEV